jgi:CHAT domain-containing protein/tetratricopeptide (TPR) repeat protein
VLVLSTGLAFQIAADGILDDRTGDYWRGKAGRLDLVAAGTEMKLSLRGITVHCPEVAAAGHTISAANDDFAVKSDEYVSVWRQAVMALNQQRANRLVDSVNGAASVVERRRGLFGRDSALTRMAEVRRASALVLGGRPREAVGLLEPIAALVSQEGALTRAEIAVLQSHVQALKWSGQPGKALPMAQRLVADLSWHLLKDDLLRFDMAAELSQLYRDARRFDDALATLAIIRSEIDATEHRTSRDALTLELATAGTLVDMRSPAALEALQTVLRKLTDRFGEEDALAQVALSNLMSEYSERGDHQRALEVAQRLLEVRLRTLGPSHPRTFFARRAIAFQQWALGRAEEAIETNRRLIDDYDAAYGPSHPETLWTIHNSVVYFQDAGRIEEALSLATRVVEAVERQSEWNLLAPLTRQSNFARYAITYKIKAELHAQLGQKEIAFEAMELAKARTLLDTTTARVARDAVLPDSPERVEVESIERELEALNVEFSRVSGDLRRSAEIDLARNRLAARLLAVHSELSAKYPRYAQLRGLRKVGFEELRRALPPRTLFLNYTLAGTSIHVAAVSREIGLSTYVQGKSPYLVGNLDTLSTLLSEPGGDNRTIWKTRSGWYRIDKGDVADTPVPARMAELLDHLGRVLLGPVAHLIRTHDSIVFSSDGELWLIPMEVLTFGGAPLLRSVQVSYAPSATVFVLSQERASTLRATVRPTALLALGGVDYSSPVVESKTGSGNQERPQADLRLRASKRDGTLAPLPESRREVLQAAQHFSKQRVATLLGQQANKDRLDQLDRDGQLRTVRLILISAHGVLDMEHPALSSVVLAPNANGERHITAADWMTYQMASDLVVVTACDTARGPTISGEGVVGLPFAFHASGNARSLLSLWRVDDKATRRFSDLLFQRLARGEPPGRALRAVKLELQSDPRYASPFYWAPFILSGAADSQPISP